MVDTPGLPGAPVGTVGMVMTDMPGTRFCDTSGIHVLAMAGKTLPGGGSAADRDVVE